MVVKIQVKVFRVVTSCSVVIKYHFRGSCSPHLHFTLKMEAAGSSDVVVSYHNTRQCQNLEELYLDSSGSGMTSGRLL